MRARHAILVFIFTTIPPVAAVSADWNGCADDLDRLRRAASDASDAAKDVNSKADEYENCKQFPDTFDLMRDNCESVASDYESAVNNLNSDLSTVDSRISSANSSCSNNASLSGIPGRAPSTGNRVCDVFRIYKDKLPAETLLKTCTASMTEAECRKCLSQ